MNIEKTVTMTCGDIQVILLIFYLTIFDFLIKIQLRFQIYHSTRHEEQFTTSRCLDANYTQFELI
jgi:hypothetical protein